MYKNLFFLPIISFILVLSACGPVNIFTSVKKRPIVYAENFIGDTIKSSDYEPCQKAWIVYSLYEKNPTYMKCGGTVTLNEMKFLEPMLVIGTKSNGKYLELIKYDPKILKDEKLTNRTDAEYYGWVDKEQMLLCNTSMIDIRTGFTNLTLTTITDTTAIFHPKTFFDNDSVKIFNDSRLLNQNKSCGIYQFVYKYKRSKDGKKWLIGTTPSINVDEVDDNILGWIDSKMLIDAGQRIWYNPNLQSDNYTYDMDLVPILNPIYKDSFMSFRTFNVNNIIDPTSNVIYSVDGGMITYDECSIIKKTLTRIDVYFTIEPSANLISQLPTITNAIQNMTSFFSDSNTYTYNFNVVIGKLKMRSNSITKVVDWLIENKNGIVAENKAIGKSWLSLTNALNIAEKNTSAINLYINIGESMPNGERAKNSIIQKISTTNGRLLAFQLFSKENDSYNNYVLQAANMIEGYAEKQSVIKRKFWVYADQIRKKNTFCETIPNSYMLDYPEKSSTQGMIVFPPKGEFMTTDILVSSTDTLLKQIKEETSEINNAFKKAFASTGNVKDKYDASLSKYLSNQNQNKINEDYKESFAQKNLQWITKSNRVKLCYKDTMYKSLCLLVTENEVNPFKSILDELVTIKVDKKGYKKSKKTRFRNIEDVRKSLSNREIYESGISHDLIVSEYSIDNIKDIVSNDSTIIEYASTKKLRNHLYKTYKKAITNSKRYECDNRKWRKKATMSDVLKLYSMLPANSELMKNMKIKDIKNKNKLSDAELEVFLKYIEEKIEAFDGEIISKNEMSSGAMKYYKININSLP